MDSAVEHRDEGFSDDGAHAGVPESEGIGAEGEHDARFGLGERGADSAGVAAYEVDLELGEVGVGDADFAEFPKPVLPMP